jgi:hypothetical protein
MVTQLQSNDSGRNPAYPPITEELSPAPPISPEQAANSVDILEQLLVRARILTNVVETVW